MKTVIETAAPIVLLSPLYLLLIIDTLIKRFANRRAGQ